MGNWDHGGFMDLGFKCWYLSGRIVIDIDSDIRAQGGQVKIVYGGLPMDQIQIHNTSVW